jgi:Predicted NADH:ubiquinone oxidoreductase, subunit RnfA
MSEYFVLLISTALVNNVVMARFLGLCPFMGVSKKIDSALGMGLATSFVIVLAASLSWILEHWLLAPLGLGYLRILTFILVIAAVVQFTEAVIHKMAPDLYQTLGIYLPLIATNCSVLGLALINVQDGPRLRHHADLRLRFGARLHPRHGHLRRHARTTGARPACRHPSPAHPSPSSSPA